MNKNKNGRPTRAGFGGNNRHGERRVCGNTKACVSGRILICKFVYAVAEALIAGIDLIVYVTGRTFGLYDSKKKER